MWQEQKLCIYKILAVTMQWKFLRDKQDIDGDDMDESYNADY